MMTPACKRSLCAFALWMAGGASAQAGGEFLLDCDRYNGELTFQIYLNLPEGYVLYNAQHRAADGDYSREREYVTVGGDGETSVYDEGLDILINDEDMIRAQGRYASFAMTKRTARYAYAWTTLVPVGGEWVPFGNHHEGQCSLNPFSR